MSEGFSLYLDLARLCSAITVVIFHSSFHQMGGGWFNFPSDYGLAAVIVFFVLSGLVIAYTTPEKHPTALDYFATRLARLWSVILPALAITAILDAIGSSISPHPYEGWGDLIGWNMPALRLFTAAIFMNEIWFVSISPLSNGAFWSLGYEFWYYAIFGAWVYSNRYRAARTAMTAAVAGPKILLLFPTWLLGALLWRERARLAIPRWFGIALLIASPLIFYYCHRKIHMRLFIFMSSTLSGYGSDHLTYAQDFVWLNLVGLCVATNFLGASAIPDLLFKALLPFKNMIRLLAGFTFSIYLLHLPLLFFFSAVFDGIIPGVARTAATVLLSLACCFAIGWFIEPRRKEMKLLLVYFATRIGQIRSATLTPNQSPRFD